MRSRAGTLFLECPAVWRLVLAPAALGLFGLMVMVGTCPTLAAEGIVEGQLKNATANGSIPSGVTVVLHVVDENERVERQSTTTDAEGRYRFDGLSASPNVRYLPVVEYQGALYFPRPFKLDQQASQTADITVYDATPSDQGIAMERANLLVQNVAPDRLDVMEMGAVANVGDRTYVGAEAPPGEAPRPTLRFAVPAGSVALAPQAGIRPEDLTPTASGFTISSPVVPGRHQLAFSYSLPFASDRLEIGKRLEYPTQTFTLYVPDVGLQIESPQLTPQGEAELGGQKFLLYGAQNLPRGAEIRVRVAGLPSPDAALAQRLALPLLVAGGTALVGALALAYARRCGGLRPSAGPEANGHAPLERTELERTHLLLALARLDEQFERGELPAEEYQRERELSKRRLVVLSGLTGKVGSGVE